MKTLLTLLAVAIVAVVCFQTEEENYCYTEYEECLGRCSGDGHVLLLCRSRCKQEAQICLRTELTSSLIWQH
ncbi:hypothetical protein ScPMuIL_011730 [Solemya velum]